MQQLQLRQGARKKMYGVLISSRKASAELALWQNRVRCSKVEERFEYCGVLQGGISTHLRSDLLGYFCDRTFDPICLTTFVHIQWQANRAGGPMMMGSPQ